MAMATDTTSKIESTRSILGTIWMERRKSTVSVPTLGLNCTYIPSQERKIYTEAGWHLGGVQEIRKKGSLDWHVTT